jgi:hypothetical protein
MHTPSSDAVIGALTVGVRFTDTMVVFLLADGREVGVPLSWYPRLESASAAQRLDYELLGGGLGVHWPTLDEDISIAAVVRP